MNERFLCFRPTRRVHESGFRYIEYGYMTCSEDGEEIEIVGQYDVILGTSFIKTPLTYHLDLTKSGWFRVMPRTEKELEWWYGGEVKEK